MNKKIFKIACIFIIVMFCLMPLGAVDLNQNDNNNKYINEDFNESTFEIKDVNASSNTNSTDFNSSQANESKSYNDNGISENKTSEGYMDPHLQIEINDIYEGEKAVAVIHTDKTFNGYVYVMYNNYGAMYIGEVVNGYCTITINSDLTEGKYNATVYFDGDDHYKACNAHTDFTVKPKKELSFNVETVHYHNRVVGFDDAYMIDFNTTCDDGNFSGPVYVKCDKTGQVQKIELIRGHGIYYFYDHYDPNQNSTFTITYSGDSKYKPFNKTYETMYDITVSRIPR